MENEKKTYGFVDITRHQAIYQHRGVFLDVFVNGERVTGKTINADDVEGFATLHKFDEAGKHVYVNDHELATERVTGVVEFKPRLQNLM